MQLVQSFMQLPGFDEKLKALRLRAEGHPSFEQKIDGFKRYWIEAFARVRRFVQEYHSFFAYFHGDINFHDSDFEEMPEQLNENNMLVTVNVAAEQAWADLQADLDKWEKIWAEKKGTHGHAPNPQEKAA